MCVCGFTGLGKSEVVPSSCNLFNFFSSFPVFNKSHGDFLCSRFHSLTFYYSLRLLHEVWGSERLTVEAAEDCGIFQQGKHFIMFWQVLHYVALMTLSAFTRMMKEVKDLYWERQTHTHKHTEEDLNALILLFLMCSYFLAFIFCLCFFLICICCSLISVKHFLTNLFDKST